MSGRIRLALELVVLSGERDCIRLCLLHCLLDQLVAGELIQPCFKASCECSVSLS